MKDNFIAILISFIVFFEIIIGAASCGTAEMMTYWKEVILPTLVIAAIYFGRR